MNRTLGVIGIFCCSVLAGLGGFLLTAETDAMPRAESAVQPQRATEKRQSARKETKKILIDINRADAKTLEKLPGVGGEIARRIIRHREKHGPFRKPEELMVIRGISRKKFHNLREYVTVGTAAQSPPGKRDQG